MLNAEIYPLGVRSKAAGIGIVTLIFCWKLVPETKGKRLEDIQAYFQARVGAGSASLPRKPLRS